MRHERSPWIYFGLVIIWLVVGVLRASMMIGNPARWVDVITILAAGILAGVYLGRIKQRLSTKSAPAADAASEPVAPK